MIGCWRARKRLWIHVAGAAPDRWLAGHLGRCPACAADARHLEREAGFLRRAGEPCPTPDADALWARIEPRLPRRRRPPLLALAPAALVAIALLGSAALRQRQQTEGGGPTPAMVAVQQPQAGPRPAQPPASHAAAVPMEPARQAGAARQEHARPAPAVRLPRRARRALTVATQGAGRAASHPRRRVSPAAPAEGLTGPALPEPAQQEPVAAVVVVQAPARAGGSVDRDTYSFCRSETEDPISGETTHLLVSRQTDASGAVRQVTIVYEVRPHAAPGVSSGT